MARKARLATSEAWQFEGLSLALDVRTEHLKGETIDQGEATGIASISTVKGVPDAVGELDIEIAYIVWDNGEHEVRCMRAVGRHQWIPRMARGLRVGIRATEEGARFMRVRVPRIGGSTQPTMYQTSVLELSQHTGTSVASVLEDAGALAIGTRHELFGAVDKQRNQLCVVFADGDTRTPVVAHYLTPVLATVKLIQAHAMAHG